MRPAAAVVDPRGVDRSARAGRARLGRHFTRGLRELDEGVLLGLAVRGKHDDQVFVDEAAESGVAILLQTILWSHPYVKAGNF